VSSVAQNRAEARGFCFFFFFVVFFHFFVDAKPSPATVRKPDDDVVKPSVKTPVKVPRKLDEAVKISPLVPRKDDAKVSVKSPPPARKPEDVVKSPAPAGKAEEATTPLSSSGKNSPMPATRSVATGAGGGVCHACSNPLKPNALFCTKCGAKSADKPVPAVKATTPSDVTATTPKAAPKPVEKDPPGLRFETEEKQINQSFFFLPPKVPPLVVKEAKKEVTGKKKKREGKKTIS
jgi:hypothetical protein